MYLLNHTYGCSVRGLELSLTKDNAGIFVEKLLTKWTHTMKIDGSVKFGLTSSRKETGNMLEVLSKFGMTEELLTVAKAAYGQEEKPAVSLKTPILWIEHTYSKEGLKPFVVLETLFQETLLDVTSPKGMLLAAKTLYQFQTTGTIPFNGPYQIAVLKGVGKKAEVIWTREKVNLLSVQESILNS